MKKTILRILEWVARLGISYGVGYLLGSIANWVLQKMKVNEEMAENYPYITIGLWILAMSIAVGCSLLIVQYPIAWIFGKIDEKIDNIEDDDPFEKD